MREDCFAVVASAMIHTLLLLLPISMEVDVLTSLKRETLRVRISSISQSQIKETKVAVTHKRVKSKRTKKETPYKAVQKDLAGQKQQKVETKTPVEKKIEAVRQKDEAVINSQGVELEKKEDTLTGTGVAETEKTIEGKDVEIGKSVGDTTTNDQSFDNEPYRGEFGEPEGPKFLKKVTPEYPPLARRHGKEGVVLLKLFIDSEGNLRDVKLLSGAEYGFGKAAIKAVKASQYIPARRNGRAVDSEVVLKVRFQLN